jgi:hypothetical protein
MAERWPWLDEWKRNLTDVLSLSASAAASLGLPQPGLLIGDPFTMIVDAARNWLIGKKRTFMLTRRPQPGNLRSYCPGCAGDRWADRGPGANRMAVRHKCS